MSKLKESELLKVAHDSIKEWTGKGAPFDVMQVEFLLSAFHKLEKRIATEGERRSARLRRAALELLDYQDRFGISPELRKLLEELEAALEEESI